MQTAAPSPCLCRPLLQTVRSEKWQNESFPNFSNFRPEFCPEFCSEFFPNFSRTFRASFRGRRRTEKIHQKSLPFFNAEFPSKHGKNIHKIFLESRQSNRLAEDASTFKWQRGKPSQTPKEKLQPKDLDVQLGRRPRPRCCTTSPCTFAVELQNDYVLGLIICENFYRNSGVSTESSQHLETRPELQDWLRFAIKMTGHGPLRNN